VYGFYSPGQEREVFIMRNDYERDNTSAATKLTFLLIGGGIGAVIALLFAPKSGVELRGDIADATRKGIEKGKEAAAQIQDRAGEYYEVLRSELASYIKQPRKRRRKLARRLVRLQPEPRIRLQRRLRPAKMHTTPKNAGRNLRQLPKDVRAIR